jgi:2-oxoglutarate dehydrogenase E2 component (dihydrolipoamide succinyltransferase)
MAVEIKVPNVGESVQEVTLSKWLVQEGDYVEVDQEICELESDKATLELPSEVAGTIAFVAKEGDDLEIGAVVAKVDTSAKRPEGSAPKEKASEAKKAEKPTPAKEEKEAPTKTPATEKGPAYAEGHPSPAAAKILAEKGIDPANVKGTGKDGRITKEDAQQAETKTAPAAEAASAYSGNFSRDTRTEQMSRLRRTIADRLVAAKNTTAMLTTFNEVDMGPIMDIRRQYKESFQKKHGVGLGFMSFFTRACVLALHRFPAVNASIDGKDITYHDYVDMGIAVSTERGLVVPVIRNAESLGMAAIEAAVIDIATRARDNKLDLDEMTGGTFTLTNGGVFGSLLSTPILNPPQSAILGMHKIEERPIALNGQVVIRPMMYLALSYDHRIIDGKESVSFLVAVKDYLEHPEKMLSGEDPVKGLLGV